MTALLTVFITAIMFSGGSCGARTKDQEAMERWVKKYDLENPVLNDSDKEVEEETHVQMLTR